MTADADSDSVTDATTSFLSDHSDGEQALRSVLEVDSEMNSWTFDDVATDSGTFGELVSRGIVQKVDGAYEVTDPTSVRAVLDGDTPTDRDSTNTTSNLDLLALPSVDLRALVGVVAALCVVAAARMTAYNLVFQRGYAISPGNDPYFFRYWLDRLVAESSGITDLSVLTNAPLATGRRPLSHATNWGLAELLGGGQGAAETVAVWLPVVGSVILGAIIYKLAVILTADVRVGIASVLVFAVTPAHVVYTGMGFLDHNVHQYFWLGVTLLTLGWLAVDLQRRLGGAETERQAALAHLRSRSTWVVAVVFGLSVGSGVHTWGGSPLLLIPLAGYIGFRVLIDARADIPPLLANLPLLAGVAIGAILSFGVHSQWGWHSGFVSTTPLLVFGGAVTVTLLAELWRRLSLRYAGLLVSEGLIAAVGVALYRQLRPTAWARAQTRIDDLFFREGITETVSLFSFDSAVIFGPLFQLGMGFYIALAVLGWIGIVAVRRYEPGWLLLGTYSGFLLITAGIQTRFAGQLAVPFSILGGLGIVYVVSAADLARPPAIFATETDSRASAENTLSPSVMLPDRGVITYLIGFGILIFGISLVFVPGLIAQTTYSPAQVNAVDAIDTHATATDRAYPANFVLSRWDENRMYNYFVSGEAQSYGYAQNNYRDFLSTPDPDSWYDRFEGRVGYVVLTDVGGDVDTESTQHQLFGNLGAGGDGHEPLSHYQLLSVDSQRSAAAFAVVPGATIEGSGQPNETVTVGTTVAVDETTVSYERNVTVNTSGQFSLTVPYPGEYTVGSTQLNVTRRAVVSGNTVSTAS